MALTRRFLQKEYWDLGKPAAVIAREQGTYPNKVVRALKKFWPVLRDQSASKKAAIAGGHARPPMAGRRHTAASKLKASAAVAAYHAGLSAEDRAARRAAAKARWAALTPARRDKVRRARDRGLRKAARTGSRLERYLARRLKKAGLEVEHRGPFGHIYLPALGVAVFVASPGPLATAFGEAKGEELDGNLRVKRLRARRAGLRVVDVAPARRPSLARMALVLDRLLDAVHSLSPHATVGDAPDVPSQDAHAPAPAPAD